MAEMLVLAVFITSIAYILGGMVVLLKRTWTSFSIIALTALSSGLILSIAILDLIPDSQRDFNDSSLFVMLGLVLMYFIAQWTRLRKKNEDDGVQAEQGSLLGISLGMLLHNFFEGLSIGISYAMSVHIGLMVSLALILHKVPEGMSYSSSVFALVRNRKKTSIYLIIQGLFTWLGAGSALLISQIGEISEQFIAIPLAMTAGIFLYIGGASLLPMTYKLSDRRIPIFFLSGILFYFIFHRLSEYVS